MQSKRRFKFATIVLIFSIIAALLLGLGAIGLLLFRAILVAFIPEVPLDGINVLLIGGAIFVGIIAILVFIAGMLAQYSTGWNIFLAIISFGIIATTGLLDGNYLITGIFGTIVVFSIMNIIDANRQNKPVAVNHSIEDKLLNLNKMFDRGLISQEEYQKARTDIINRIE